jgi:hypothetical protein
MSDDNTRENPESYPQKPPWRGTLREIVAREKAAAYANGATFRDAYYEEWLQAEDRRHEDQQAIKRESMGRDEDRRRHIAAREQRERER